MAHVILAELLKEAEPDVLVRSAGLLDGGLPSTREAIEVMARRNLDLGSHLSTTLSESLREPHDLIVGMASHHVREVVVLEPELLSRTFTLKDLVRRAEEGGPRHRGESLQTYLERLGEGRRTSEMMGNQDDVADPIGQGISVYEETAKQIYDLVCRLKRNLWPTLRR